MRELISLSSVSGISVLAGRIDSGASFNSGFAETMNTRADGAAIVCASEAVDPSAADQAIAAITCFMASPTVAMESSACGHVPRNTMSRRVPNIPQLRQRGNPDVPGRSGANLTAPLPGSSDSTKPPVVCATAGGFVIAPVERRIRSAPTPQRGAAPGLEFAITEAA
ncbi:hypothetical protein SPHINGO361_150105 [Sphingomonas sp. EC-HK361]|nr:hypothetical protein SPHINGO361_150105 [Sphingomonas sp. EC-HK361]